MPGRGRQFKFFGAYGTKAAAIRKERQVHGFIRRTEYPSGPRWLVLKPNAPNAPNLRSATRILTKYCPSCGTYHVPVKRRENRRRRGLLGGFDTGALFNLAIYGGAFYLLYSGGYLTKFGEWLQTAMSKLTASFATTQGCPTGATTSATVWISDPALGGDGSYSTGLRPPGASPPWREASQYEIQQIIGSGGQGLLPGTSQPPAGQTALTAEQQHALTNTGHVGVVSVEQATNLGLIEGVDYPLPDGTYLAQY